MVRTNLWSRDWQEHMKRQLHLTGTDAEVSVNMKRTGLDFQTVVPPGATKPKDRVCQAIAGRRKEGPARWPGTLAYNASA